MKTETLLRLVPTGWPRWLRLAAGIIVFSALVPVALDNRRQLMDISWHLDVVPLAASACILMITYYLSILGWHRVMASLGSTSTFEDTARVWLYSNLARYLPGKMWYAVGRVVLSNDVGISPVVASLGVVLEIAFLLISHALVAVVGWPLWMSRALPTIPWFPSIAMTVGAVASAHPKVLSWGFAQCRRFGGDRLVAQSDHDIQLHYRDTLQTLAIYVAEACMMGVAFYLLARALTPLPLSAIPSVTGIFALAWLIGFVSLFAPGGLGVREGVLAYLLSSMVAGPAAIAIAVLSRACLVASELLCVALVKLAERRGRSTGSRNNRRRSVSNVGLLPNAADHHD